MKPRVDLAQWLEIKVFLKWRDGHFVGGESIFDHPSTLRYTHIFRFVPKDVRGWVFHCFFFSDKKKIKPKSHMTFRRDNDMQHPLVHTYSISPEWFYTSMLWTSLDGYCDLASIELLLSIRREGKGVSLPPIYAIYLYIYAVSYTHLTLPTKLEV